MRRQSFSALILGCMLAGGGLLTAQQVTIPIALPTPTFSFGMIGFTSLQTIRLNVVNLVRTPPPIAIAQVPCKVELDFYDAQGTLVKHTTIASLGSGQAASLDLGRAEVLSPVAGRVEVAGVVKVGSNQSFFCSISPTIEVMDANGSTIAVLANASAGMPWGFVGFLGSVPGPVASAER